jgi:hypothetical protein
MDEGKDPWQSSGSAADRNRSDLSGGDCKAWRDINEPTGSELAVRKE